MSVKVNGLYIGAVSLHKGQKAALHCSARLTKLAGIYLNNQSNKSFNARRHASFAYTEYPRRTSRPPTLIRSNPPQRNLIRSPK